MSFPLSNALNSGDRAYIASLGALRQGHTTLPGFEGVKIPAPGQIQAYIKNVVLSWDTHEFTEDERTTIRNESLRYLVLTYEIEQIQRDIWPRPLPPEVESQKQFSWQNYQIRFFRLFRVNDLPTEVLTNIIRLAVWDSPRTPVVARMNITWACKRWREVALNDATLWTAIWFRPQPAQMERALAYLDRAKDAPVDIRFSAYDEADTSVKVAGDNFREALTRIMDKRLTIRHLLVMIDTWEHVFIVLDVLSTLGRLGMPRLERFEFYRGMTLEDKNALQWPQVDLQPLLGGGPAPRLTYLGLNGIPIDWTRSILENLTTFVLCRLPQSYMPDLARFREILSACPRLIKLTLDGAGPRFDENADKMALDPIDLPHLRTLLLCDLTRSYALFVLSTFTAQNVNELTLMNLYGEDFSDVCGAMTGMFPQTQILTVYSLQFEPHGSGVPTMTRWLESMPRLAYLRVANQTPFFFGLFLRQQNPAAPLLKTVDCSAVEPLDIFVKWAEARVRLNVPLERIYLSDRVGEAFRRRNDLLQALVKCCRVTVLPRGAPTPEELALQKVG
ncbi:F-box domain-containing protein [Mycena chlorophos]|uniref:F-box domain-containing protein n=1 Tax=Mycena chlorophos TaxID=658473 RepID=A0A8H6WL83_MYCCL|nr:F-box domain-containing protein [Mycena chlorophos]